MSSSSEGLFSMDPEKVIWILARRFVDGQETTADIAGTIDRMQHSAAIDTPEAQKLIADAKRTVDRWHREVIPSLAASMKLAIEVYETFGPGMTTITDETDAAIWNNRYHVWANELSFGPPGDA